MLRRSLNDLADLQVIDEGWTIAQGVVRWRKSRPVNSLANADSPAPVAEEFATAAAADIIDG
jgi:hypothetical protein